MRCRCFVLVLLGLLTRLAAHPLDEVRQETRIALAGDQVVVSYRTVYGALVSSYIQLAADKDGDGSISEAEREGHVRTFGTSVAQRLKVTLAGQLVPLAYHHGEWLPASEEGQQQTLLELRGTLPAPSGTLRLEEGNFGPRVLSGLQWELRVAGEPWPFTLSEEDRVLVAELAPPPAATATASPPAPLPATASASTDSVVSAPISASASHNPMERTLRTPELGPGALLVALLVAFGLGASHALSPGHGKAMVAAYLVGTRGRARDAVILGGVVTITHVIGVLALGVVLLIALDVWLPQRLMPWLGFASGLLICGVGLTLLIRRALGLQAAHDHDHTHEHDHGHSHGWFGGHHHHHVAVPRPTMPLVEGVDKLEAWQPASEAAVAARPREGLGGLVALGISAGLVPCPSALVILLTAVALHRVLLGLLLIVSFSLGLACTLMVLGLVVVKAGDLLGRRFTDAQRLRWQTRLAVASAVLIVILGLAVALGALFEGGVLKFSA